MNPVARSALRFLLLVSAYLFGAQVALWFVQGPDQVTLVWPPAGVVYGALLLYGLRWWPFVVVSVLLTHALLAPVPTLFLPYSVLSNVLGGCAGAWYVLRFRPLAAEKYTLGGGFGLLFGGLIMVAISALVGTLGMWHAGMVESNLLQAGLRWAMGDLFGVIAVGPAVILAARQWFAWLQ